MSSIVRYEAPPNEIIHDDRYMDRIPAMAERFARSSMCPDFVRGKPDDVAIIAYSLADVGLRLTLNTLPQCYVVHGKVGFMAQIQAALAARYGYTIRPVDGKYDSESATVEVVTPNGERHEVTFTMAQAAAGGLTKNEVYKKFPIDMLIARATTRAIKRYAPEVMLGLAGTANAQEIENEESENPPETRPAAQLQPKLVAAVKAKNQIFNHFRADHDKETAIALTNQLWEAHELGLQQIPVELLDQLIAEAALPVEDAEIVEDEDDGRPFDVE